MRRYLMIIIGMLMASLIVAVSVPASSAPHDVLSANHSYSHSQSQSNAKIRVWVNTHSGVYHCPGTRWYGRTKSGEYMAQGEAQQKGYRPAYGRACQSGGGETGSPKTSEKKGSETSGSHHAGNPNVKVWVNTRSGVYHCPGTRWYGRTKSGEYMTQGKAEYAGDRPAHGKVCQ